MITALLAVYVVFRLVRMVIDGHHKRRAKAANERANLLKSELAAKDALLRALLERVR